MTVPLKFQIQGVSAPDLRPRSVPLMAYIGGAGGGGTVDPGGGGDVERGDVTVVGSNSQSQGAADNTLNAPAGRASGDFLVAGFTYLQPTATPATPAGWTQLIDVSPGGAANPWPKLLVLTRTADGTTADNIAFSGVMGGSNVGAMRVFRGVDATIDPIVETALDATLNTSMDLPAITTVYPNSMILRIGAVGDDNSGIPATFAQTDLESLSSTWNIVTQFGGDCGFTAWHGVKAEPGVVSLETLTLAASEYHIGVSIALAPAPI